MDWLPLILLALLLVLVVGAFGRSMWRMSERDYERDQSRRGEDEDPDERFDDRGALRRHWGGWGRPG
jgi:hypothetical protein